MQHTTETWLQRRLNEMFAGSHACRASRPGRQIWGMLGSSADDASARRSSCLDLAMFRMRGCTTWGRPYNYVESVVVAV
jgi:hypothetical protein